MKFILFILLTQLFFFTSCNKHGKEYSIVNHVENLMETDLDSAYLLLNSIENLDRLNDELFAHWCLLFGKVADNLHKDMPYSSFLLKAQAWYEQHGTEYEQVQISLYLGRSYVEDKKYDEAMNIYTRALDIAKNSREYNLAGYICSYMADLYELKNMLNQSRCKYQEGADYFVKALNNRSYAFALRDVSYIFCLQDSFDLALHNLKKADSIVLLLKDSVALSSIANAFGNVYSFMGNLDYAEKYLLKSLDLNKTEVAPTYLALSTLHLNNGGLSKAEYYLEKSKVQTRNDYTSIGITYQYYLLEKMYNNTDKALLYLELYIQAYDSISTVMNNVQVLEVEKKYNHVKLLNENNQLRINQLYSIILFVLVAACCLLLAFLYQVKVKRDKEKICNQQRLLDTKEKRLLQFIADLDKKENELQRLKSLLIQGDNQKDVQELLNQQELEYQKQRIEIVQARKEINALKNKILFLQPIVKKIVKLSQVIIPGSSKSPLTIKDWQVLVNNINNIYFLFNEILEKKGFKENTVEIRYCYLSLLQLNKNQESVILHINPDSVSKLRFRVRQRLQISGEKTSVYEFLMDMSLFI